MSGGLAARLGLPPRPSPAQVAAALAFRLPVALGSPGEARSPGEVLAGDGVARPEEAAAIVSALLPGAEPEGGGPLPRLRVAGGVLGPALPVLVTSPESEGPDGWYRRTSGGVEREAAGRAAPYDQGLGSSGPALLLFTPDARWLLGSGRVVVEDRFCRAEGPLDPAWAEAFLLRRLRLPPGLLRHPALVPAAAARSLTVFRALALVEPGPWSDPGAVLGVREGVRRVRRDGPRLELELENGSGAVFEVEALREGWTADLAAGRFPALRASMEAVGSAVRYTWELGAGLDPLDAGVRARLAFDLISDLIRLAQKV